MSYEEFGPVAVQAAQSAGIDPALFTRMINQESGFNPSAGSPAGAQGIAQFMPATAQSLGIDPSDPVQALYGAAHLMRTYLDEFGNYADALTAYNAGPGAVGKALPQETQQYLGNILGGQGSAPMAPNTPQQPPLSDAQIGPLIGQRGYVWISGSGPDAVWGVPLVDTNGNVVMNGDNYPKADPDPSKRYSQADLANGLFKERSPYYSAAAPDAAGGFSLSPGQTRYNANGQPIAQAPSVNTNDPFALEKVQNDRTSLALQIQAQQFNQNKYNFEMASGLRDEANKTQELLFQNKLNIAQLQNTIATNIGTLAANPGDLGKYFGTTMGMTLAQQAAAPAKGAYITDRSLAPLGSLLDLQSGGLPQAPNLQMPPAAQPISGGLDLGALLGGGARVPAAVPQQSTNPAQSVLGAIAPAYNPQTPDATQNATGSVGNPAAPMNQAPPLPAAANGGLEQSAYISGEKGPELNIPTASGAVVLNKDQMASLGINLKSLMKMADGGIFDVTPQKPQPKARDFVGDLASNLSNYLGLEGRAPNVTYAASPSVSPLYAQALGSLQSAYSGQKPEQFDWLRNILMPQGVNERVIGRSA